MDENKILKLVEQAYRKGLRDGNKTNDLAPYLVVSQVVAHELVKNLTIPDVMPRFFLGQKVKTKLGNGTIVELKMHWNGLYIQPERMIAKVWFGTNNDSTKWISQDFQIDMIEPLNVA